MGGRGSGCCNYFYRASKSVGHSPKCTDDMRKIDIFTRLLSNRSPRRKNAPRYDIIEIANRHLFTNKLLTATLHYDVFDRLSIEPSG